MGSSRPPPPVVEFFDPGEGLVRRLPTDPAQLEQTIRQQVQQAMRQQRLAGSLDGWIFTLIGGLLRSPAATPALQAALFQVAAHLDGVSLAPDVLDPLGRHAIAVGMMTSDIDLRRELLFDPTTYQLLSERWVVATAAAGRALDGVPVGAATFYSAVGSSGVVASDHATPPR